MKSDFCNAMNSQSFVLTESFKVKHLQQSQRFVLFPRYQLPNIYEMWNFAYR